VNKHIGLVGLGMVARDSGGNVLRSNCPDSCR
jgi:hypothetical protein